MKHLLLLLIVFALFGCESINTKQAATDSVNYADLKKAYQPCFIVDKNLSKHATIVTTPEFMDNNYGFFVENHFKRDNTVILDVGHMIEDDIHHISEEMFGSQCFISSLNEFTDQGNLVVKVDLVTSNINVPEDFNDKIVSQIGVLYSFYDTQGNELFKVEVSEEDEQKASSRAAYRKVTNRTVDKVIASSKALISQSLSSMR
jgi:hypothetical protein